MDVVQEFWYTTLQDLRWDPIWTSGLVVFKAPNGILDLSYGGWFPHIFSDGTLRDVADATWFSCAVTVEEFLEMLFPSDVNGLIVL